MKRSYAVTAGVLALVAVGASAAWLRVSPRRSAAPRATATAAVARATPTAARVVTLEVGGMVCAGCVAKIDRELTRVPGVVSADVSLRDQRAQVVCDASVADTALTAAVRRAGPEYLGLIVQ